MARISIDNGMSYIGADEAVRVMDWDAIMQMMDDETREIVAEELAPCTEAEFLSRYLKLAKDDLIIG